MKIDQFLTELRSVHNISIAVENGELKLRAEKNNLTPGIINEIKLRKADILDFYNAVKLRQSDKVGEIPKCRKKDSYKLSSAQSRLFFIEQLGSSTAYNLPQIVKLRGCLNKELFERAFSELIRRHDVFRSSFHTALDGPVQIVAAELDFKVEYLKSDKQTVDQVIKAFIQPFDLAKAPLFRVGIIEIAFDEWIMVADMHHIITDGISQGIVIRDFLALYNNEELPALSLQYTDYAEWQQSDEQQIKIEKQKEFWLNEFSEEADPLELPLDFTRGSERDYRGATVKFTLEKDSADRIRKTAEINGVTINSVLFALYTVLLSRLGNQDDIIVGIPSAGRTHPDLEEMAGMFINTLPVRSKLSNNLSFNEFVKATHQKLLSCFQNQMFQYDQLLDELKIERELNRNPLFDTVFVYQNFKRQKLEIPDLELIPYGIEQTESKFDLVLEAVENGSEFEMSFHYALSLFKQETVFQFGEFFKCLVENIVKDDNANLSDIGILTEQDWLKLKEFNQTARNYPKGETLISLFEEQVKNVPSNIALVMGNQSITYGELNDFANWIAERIEELTPQRSNRIVALFFEPSFAMVASILGILKTGSAYLPLSTEVPVSRNQYIISDADASLLLTDSDIAHKAPAGACVTTFIPQCIVGHESGRSGSAVNSDDLAYVIYTSGTTGNPKGVEVVHSGVINMLYVFKDLFQQHAGSRMSQVASISFDASVLEIWPALTSGATLFIAPGEVRLDPVLMKAWLGDHSIEVTFQTPAIAQFLLRENWKDNTSLRVLSTGGEKLIYTPAEKLTFAIYNLYGPTEDSVWTTWTEVSSQNQRDFYSIGKPMANKKIFFLDKENNIQPIGVAGELCIAGDGLAKGYINNPVLTSQKFVNNVKGLPGVRLYKTGDRGRWMPDGNIEYLGRNDSQVKIRGFRIELSEIERVFEAHPQIKQVAVLMKEQLGNKIIAAYYTSAVHLASADLRDYLSEFLPEYMIPSAFIHLAAFPLNSSGKVDRRAFPEPEITVSERRIAPEGYEEELLADVWESVLGIKGVGVTTNFFTTGGDSIKSIQISSRMRALGYDVTVKDIFTNQTIREHARKLKKLSRTSGQEEVKGRGELSPVQKWFFKTPLANKHHFNQSVMLHFKNGLGLEAVKNIFSKLQNHHDVLRTVFKEQDGIYLPDTLADNGNVWIAEWDLTKENDVARALEEKANEIQSGIDLSTGPLVRLGLFHLKDGCRLLVVIHHLVVDGVSWRILLEDIETLYLQNQAGKTLVLPLKTDPFKSWALQLKEYTTSPAFNTACAYWDKVSGTEVTPLIHDARIIPVSAEQESNAFFQLSKETTTKLLKEVNVPFNTQINDILLTALVLSVKNNFSLESIKVDLEGHGRENIDRDTDFSRTVGWFSTFYPVILECKHQSLAKLIKQVKETLRNVPNNGLDYLLYRYNNQSLSDNTTERNPGADILFNYLGQFDADIEGKSFQIATESRGKETLSESLNYNLSIAGAVSAGRLVINISYDSRRFRGETVHKLAEKFKESLEQVISYCCLYNKIELSPSDLTIKGLGMPELDKLQAGYAIKDIYTLSPMQEGMLFHSLFDTASVSYFSQTSYNLKGKLHIDAASESFQDLIKRHDILRTIFLNEEHRNIQLVLKEIKGDFFYKDITSECNEENKEYVLNRYRQLDKASLFNLKTGPLFRLKILKTAENEHTFIWSNHHILMDGWCIGILANEFNILYQRHHNIKHVVLPEAKPFSLFIKWLETRDKSLSINYWANYLLSYTEQTTLPRNGKAIRNNEKQYAPELAALRLNSSQTKDLGDLCGTYNITLNTVIQTAWAILLAHYNNTRDVLFGTVVSGRPAEIDGIESMIGLFINTVPSRVKYSDTDTFETLIEKVQKDAIERDQYSHCSLSEIQLLSDSGRDLFNHILVFENFPVNKYIGERDTDNVAEYKIEDVSSSEQTNYDLTIIVVPGTELVIRFEYNSNIYDTEIIGRVITHLNSIIDQIIINPSQKVIDTGILSEREELQIIQKFNNTNNTLFESDETIIHTFNKRADLFSGRIAVKYGNTSLSYSELKEKTDSIARFLTEEKGIITGDLVGLMIERDSDFIPLIFGLLKSGAVYIPIDPKYPAERINSIVEDSDLKFIITKSSLKKQLNAGHEQVYFDEWEQHIYRHHAFNFNPLVSSSDLAYIIYTSGSTGKSKGVMIEHASLQNIILHLQQAYPLNQTDSYLLKTNFTFDVSVAEIFGWFLEGGTLSVLPAGAEYEPHTILSQIKSDNITHINFVPSMFSVMADELERNGTESINKLKYIFLAGEALPVNLVERFNKLNTGIYLQNIYGPTEGTIYSSGFDTGNLQTSWSVPIGKPLSNVKLYILNKDGHRCPVGVAGELCIGGAGLARGYINNPGLTSLKFVFHSSLNERLYKTGDLARWLPDGNIEYLGRLDDQIKINGFRIELGEIEQTLQHHPQVSQAVVLLKERSGNKYLAAYFTGSAEVSHDELKSYLSEYLPVYMIPPGFIHLAEFPLNNSGKVDKKSLPESDMASLGEYIAPVGLEEELLAEVWGTVLGIDRIGANANFFYVGGDSIKSIQISSRMRSLGYEVTVKDIFTHSTIRELARRLKKLSKISSQEEVTGKSELSPVQKWFFEGSTTDKHHFNQSVMLHFKEGLNRDVAERIFRKIQDHHDALRMVFKKDEDHNYAETLNAGGEVWMAEWNLTAEGDVLNVLEERANTIQSGIDLDDGPLIRLGLFHVEDGSRLLIVIHHLVVDGISWRILLEDIETLYRQIRAGEVLSLPLKTDSFQSWPSLLNEYTHTRSFLDASEYWSTFLNNEKVGKAETENKKGLIRDTVHFSVSFSSDVTSKLLTEVHMPFNTQINDILLTAFVVAYARVFEKKSVLIDLEGHGREKINCEADYSRTIGWFTSIFPVLLECEDSDLSDTIKGVKETLRSIPNNGVDYLLYSYPSATNHRHAPGQPGICFNYLGQFDTGKDGDLFLLTRDKSGIEVSENAERKYNIELACWIVAGKLTMRISYCSGMYKDDLIASFMSEYREGLIKIVDYCCSLKARVLTPSDLTYKKLSFEELETLASRYEIEDIYSLSPMQEGMLYHSLLNDSDSYLGQAVCYLSGNLNPDAVESGMNEIIARYDILRAVFLHTVAEERIQVITRNKRIKFLFKDISEDCRTQSEAEVIEAYRKQDQLMKFDLSNDVLMRLSVLKIAEDRYVLIWSYHHILLDGWCMAGIIGDFEAIYASKIKQLPLRLPDVEPYSGYIKWLQEQDSSEGLNYWKNYLSLYENISGLPKKSSLLIRNNYMLQSCKSVLSGELSDLLRKVSAQHGVTVNTIFQVAWGILLSRFSNANDVVFGAVVSGRPAEIPGVEAMVGLFINTVPVRIKFSPRETVANLLGRIQLNATEGEQYHYCPLAEIQSGNADFPLFDHIMVLENFPEVANSAGDDKLLHLEKVEYTVRTNYDLSIKFIPGEEFTIQMDYNSDCYQSRMIGLFAEYLTNVLEYVCYKPLDQIKDIQLYSESELSQMKRDFAKDLDSNSALATIQSMLSESFTKNYQRLAIETSEEQLSYADLDIRAEQVRSVIASRNIPMQSAVGIYCNDRTWFIASVLAILRARMVFVPLETSLPKPRLRSMVNQTGLQYIISDEAPIAFEAEVTGNQPLWLQVGPELPQLVTFFNAESYSLKDKVYIYFTSGSTGAPKGVLGGNKGLSHFINWEIDQFNIDHTFRFSQFTNPGFDVFMRDIFVPLCSGATICIPDAMEFSAGERIGQWLEDKRINFIHCVPSLFKLFSQNAESASQYFNHLKFILLAGEKIAPFELLEWYERFENRIQLVNIYGPTETTLAKACYYIHPSDSQRSYIPVKSIKGAQFILLDSNGNICPEGAIGEIYIRTPNRTFGYLDETETQKVFIQNPFNNDRADLIYKTGDLGRRYSSDEIEILGRTDHQVKINGIRVELDDIKKNILSYPEISESLVVVNDNGAQKTIVAYIVSAEDINIDDLKEYLKGSLPGYMMPGYISVLEKIPLLINGKVDRKALPKPVARKESHIEQPTNETEAGLLLIWADILKVAGQDISTTAGFFELGGHSIKAFNLVYLIQQRFNVKISLADVFSFNTVQKQAKLIDSKSFAVFDAIIPKSQNSGFCTASPAQQRMYFQHSLYQNSTMYNISLAVKVNPVVIVERLEKAFQSLINRHPSLRTSFHLTDDGVMQRVHQEVLFKLILLKTEKEIDVRPAFINFISPFDLSSRSLLRVALMEDRKGGRFLFIDLHHIISDGYSLNILISEFEKIYHEESLPDLNLDYTDYSAWINNLSGDLNAQKSYWASRLIPLPPPLELPVSFYQNQQTVHPAATKYLIIPDEQYTEIKKLLKKHNVSDYMFLLSVYYLLLSKVSDCTDIIVGTDVIGRTRPDLKRIVGTFVNILPLRLNLLPEHSFCQHLLHVKNCVLSAFENQDFQFDQMVSMLKAQAGLMDQPLVKVHFSFSNVVEESSSQLFETFNAGSRREEITDYEFKVEVREGLNTTDLVFIYNTGLYDSDTIDLMVAYYQSILSTVLKNDSVRIVDIELETLPYIN